MLCFFETSARLYSDCVISKKNVVLDLEIDGFALMFFTCRCHILFWDIKFCAVTHCVDGLGRTVSSVYVLLLCLVSGKLIVRNVDCKVKPHDVVVLLQLLSDFVVFP